MSFQEPFTKAVLDPDKIAGSMPIKRTYQVKICGLTLIDFVDLPCLFIPWKAFGSGSQDLVPGSTTWHPETEPATQSMIDNKSEGFTYSDLSVAIGFWALILLLLIKMPALAQPIINYLMTTKGQKQKLKDIEILLRQSLALSSGSSTNLEFMRDEVEQFLKWKRYQENPFRASPP